MDTEMGREGRQGAGAGGKVGEGQRGSEGETHTYPAYVPVLRTEEAYPHPTPTTYSFTVKSTRKEKCN